MNAIWLTRSDFEAKYGVTKTEYLEWAEYANANWGAPTDPSSYSGERAYVGNKFGSWILKDGNFVAVSSPEQLANRVSWWAPNAQQEPNADPTLTDIALAGIGTSALTVEILSSHIINSRSGYSSGKINPNSPRIYSKGNARGIHYGAKGIGWALTFGTIYNTESQFENEKIDLYRRQYNHMNSAVGIFAPRLAIPVAIGDYLGQSYSDQIIQDMTQPDGVTFEVTKFLLEFVGIPTSAP